MSWRARLAAWIGGEKINNATPLPQITRGSDEWEAFVGGSSSAIPAPTEKTAMMVPAIYASVNLIAGAISALPVHLYRVNISDGERVRLFDDPLIWTFNEQMTDRWSAAAGWEFLVQSLLLHGDAFAVIIRGPAGTPIGLMPVHPSRVTVAMWPDGSRLAYSVAPELTPSKGAQVYDQDDILHVAGFGFDGLRGMSPLRYALRMTGAVSIATQEFAANFFANSARPDYALTTDQKLSPEAIEDLRKQVDDRHSTLNNASHRPMLLHSGLDIKTITMPLQELQMLETRQFQIEDIARIYGVPPFMIGHNEKTTSWGSGVESMGIGFVRYTLRQHLNKFQNEINRKFFRTASRMVEFETSDLERADTSSLYQSLRVLVGRAGESRIATINEVRAVLRLKKDTDPDSDALGVNPGQGTPANEAPQPSQSV